MQDGPRVEVFGEGFFEFGGHDINVCEHRAANGGEEGAKRRGGFGVLAPEAGAHFALSLDGGRLYFVVTFNVTVVIMGGSWHTL